MRDFWPKISGSSTSLRPDFTHSNHINVRCGSKVSMKTSSDHAAFLAWLLTGRFFFFILRAFQKSASTQYGV